MFGAKGLANGTVRDGLMALTSVERRCNNIFKQSAGLQPLLYIF